MSGVASKKPQKHVVWGDSCPLFQSRETDMIRYSKIYVPSQKCIHKKQKNILYVW